MSITAYAVIGVALLAVFVVLRLSSLVMTGRLKIGPLQRRGNYRPQRAKPYLWSPDYLIMGALYKGLSQCRGYLKGDVLDVGCGHQIYRKLFTDINRFIGLELDKRLTESQVIGSCLSLPFHSESFHGVLMTQVLEHLPNPFQAISEITRVLKPDGFLVLTAPQAWRLHGVPHDYFRFTRFGLAQLMESNNLHLVLIKTQGGVWALLGQTFLNLLPHRNLFPFTVPLVIGTNWIARFLDFIWFDPDDTLNYLLVCRKG
jgi:SAM-dependent methyltransferase